MGADSRVQPLRSSSSRKPAAQEHWKEPARLAQWCSQPPRPDAHSSTSVGKPGSGPWEAPPTPLPAGPRPRGSAWVSPHSHLPPTPCFPPFPPFPRLRVMGDARPVTDQRPQVGEPAGRSLQTDRRPARPLPGLLTLTPAAIGAEPVAGVAAALVSARAVGADLLAARRVRTVINVYGHTGARWHRDPTPPTRHARTHRRSCPAHRHPQDRRHGSCYGPDWGLGRRDPHTA